jgi:hypothetical protein
LASSEALAKSGSRVTDYEASRDLDIPPNLDEINAGRHQNNREAVIEQYLFFQAFFTTAIESTLSGEDLIGSILINPCLLAGIRLTTTSYGPGFPASHVKAQYANHPRSRSHDCLQICERKESTSVD